MRPALGGCASGHLLDFLTDFSEELVYRPGAKHGQRSYDEKDNRDKPQTNDKF
jgi:hypothetical protein